MKEFTQNTKIYFGEDSIKSIYHLNGKKAFIVIDKMMIELDYLSKITFILDEKKIDWALFSNVEQDPTLESIRQGFNKYIEFKPDILIALGGGSVIDTAKSILYLFKDKLMTYLDREYMIKPLFVAIPTTSGSGSEITGYTVITDKNKKKVPLVDPLMLPDIAILDRQFTLSMPPTITADTGLDVLTHGIEAYLSKEATEFTSMYAEKAIENVFHYLVRAYRNGNDKEAREKMHLASTMAGLAFSNAGLGINHSLAHAIGARFKIPHGRANAILLPYVIEYNSQLGENNDSIIGKEYAQLSKNLGFPSQTIKEGIISLLIAVETLKLQMKIPRTLEEEGIDKKEFQEIIEELAEIALEDLCSKSNPKEVGLKDLISILNKSYKGQGNLNKLL